MPAMGFDGQLRVSAQFDARNAASRCADDVARMACARENAALCGPCRSRRASEYSRAIVKTDFIRLGFFIVVR